MKKKKNIIISICIVLLGMIIISLKYCFLFQSSFNDATTIITNKQYFDFEIGTIIISIIGIVLLLAIIVLSKKTWMRVGYIRDTKCVIEPVLAECLIDGKIDSKNLIMTVLTELIYNKQIKMENNKLTLISVDKMGVYERRIIDLIFYGVGDSVDIGDLDRKFHNENREQYIEIYKDAKRMIKQRLFNEEIFKKSNIISKVFQGVLNIYMLVMLIYIGLPRFPFIDSRYEKIWIFVSAICLMTVGIILRYCFKINYGQRNYKWYSGLGTTIIPFLIYIITTVLFNSLSYGIEYFINIFLIVLNFLESIYLKRIIKEELIILTKKGKEEYKKACGLKKYIKNYSLIKDKEIDSIALWDEYLIYATAFGIPNKVTDKFSVKLIDIDKVLERAEVAMNLHILDNITLK